jgi:Mce-associated membrane protein
MSQRPFAAEIGDHDADADVDLDTADATPAPRTSRPRARSKPPAPIDEPDVELSGAAEPPRSRPRPVAAPARAAAEPPRRPERVERTVSRTQPASRDAGPRSRPLVGALAVACVVIVGLLAAFVLAEKSLANNNAANDARTSAVSAAKTFAMSLASYDYNTVDQDFNTVLEHSTGEFKQKFASNSAAQQDKIVKFQATATGTVFDAAATDVTGDRATVLVMVDQKVTNTSLQGPAVEHDRLRLTMVRNGNDWLVSKLETF